MSEQSKPQPGVDVNVDVDQGKQGGQENPGDPSPGGGQGDGEQGGQKGGGEGDPGDESR